MEIDRRELKSRAKEAIRASVPAFWTVALVYFLMTAGVSSLLDFLPLGLGYFSVFVSILYTLYSQVVNFGFDLWTLWTWRRLEPGLDSLIQGFQVAGRVILMQVLIFFRILGWALLYSFVWMFPMLLLPMLSYALTPFMLVGAVVLSVALELRYALAPYLLADHPDDGPAAAVRRSAMLMQGWKWELFKFEFSFIGWIILGNVLAWAVEGFLLWRNGFFSLAVSALSSVSFSFFNLFPSLAAAAAELQPVFSAVDTAPLTILLSNLLTLPVFLWLMPYRGTARAGFYEARLQAQKDSAPELPPL